MKYHEIDIKYSSKAINRRLENYHGVLYVMKNGYYFDGTPKKSNDALYKTNVILPFLEQIGALRDSLVLCQSYEIFQLTFEEVNLIRLLGNKINYNHKLFDRGTSFYSEINYDFGQQYYLPILFSHP